MFIRGAVALVILVAAYWGWALAGAAQLASAAQRGDAEAVMERVDLQALIRSLSGQVARAFAKQNPQLQHLPLVRQGVFLNGAAAEMLLRALLTPENIAALLNQRARGSSTPAERTPGRPGGCPRSARRSTPVPCRS
jgi:Protein of unknown function (DUF2939)